MSSFWSSHLPKSPPRPPGPRASIFLGTLVEKAVLSSTFMNRVLGNVDYGLSNHYV